MPKPYAKSPNLKAIICQRNLQIFKMQNYRLEVSFLDPPIIPPGGQRIPQVIHKIRLVVDQNFVFRKCLACIRFRKNLGSLWGRLGAKLGSFLALLAGQDGPSSVQNASWKLIDIKNVNFHQTLCLPIPQRFLEPQDASLNAPRSAQDGSKRLLKSIFLLLKIV